MDLFEHQGKELFAAAGIPVLPSRLARDRAEAERPQRELGFPLAVKAQVLTGGRGKAGGVRVVRSREELGEAVETILGLTIKGKPVRAVLLEQGAAVLRELYLAITLDRHAKSPVADLLHARRRRHRAGRQGRSRRAAAAAAGRRVGGLRRACRARGRGGGSGRPRARRAAGRPGPAPLGALPRARRVACRGQSAGASSTIPSGSSRSTPRSTIDDNALYRQPDLAAQRPDEDARERAAREAGVTYLTLDGDVGVLGNGAGLVMSTLDMIGAAGGAAADFCDIGGGARAERIAAALDIITSDDRVRALLVNIFGGITRGDEVARGVLAWRGDTSVGLPLVVRLDGNNAAEGLQLLAAAGLDGLIVTQSAQEAVEAVVAAAARIGGRT